MATELETLAALLEKSTEMLAAAERLEWEQLSRLSQTYFSLFGTLPETAGATAAEDRAKRVALLRALSSNESLIRDCVEPWLASMGTLLDALAAAKSAEPHRHT